MFLPDFHSTEVSILVSILYGANLALDESMAQAVDTLAAHLGLSIDLPYRTSAQQPPPAQLDPGTVATLGLPQGPTSVTEVMLCWHCKKPFDNMELLQNHMAIHQGERFKQKLHRCQQCRAVLPSMWKFRQHLLKHSAPKETPKNDHLYAETPSQNPQKSQDHQYATKEVSDHSYGTRRAAKSADHAYTSATGERVPVSVPLPQVPVSIAITEHQAQSIPAKTPAPIKRPQKVSGTPQDDHMYSSAISIRPDPNKRSPSDVKKKSLSIPTKKKVKAKSRQQSIQALGHSYAAARPRRVSGAKAGESQMMYPCDQCDKEFPLPYRLNRHIREVHVKEKVHFCKFCDKSFFKVTSKDRHELTHSEHTLWTCQDCKRAFRDQSSLKYHVKHKVCHREKKTK